MGWIRSCTGNGPDRKAHGPFCEDLTFSSPRLTYDTSLRHVRYLEVARILCIWSWSLLNIQLEEIV